jgi:ferritin
MLSKNVQASLNEQFNVELYSAYAYLAMSAHFVATHLDGFAQWMKIQAEEEMVHAMKYYTYLNERGGEVIFKPIAAPNSKWETPLDVFKDALKQEQKNTKLINEQMELAFQEKDHASQIFLQWLVTEQVEEEQSIVSIVEKLKLINNDPSGLLILDQNLGQRPAEAAAE